MAEVAPLVDRLRAMCLSFPDATEKRAWGEPTFRIRDRIFAMVHMGQDDPQVWCKSEIELRDALIASDSGHYFSPPYVGHKGWIGIRLNDSTDWDGVQTLVEESYLLIAARGRKGRRRSTEAI